MRHDPKSLLDRLDEPVALAVERDRIARWELFRAREEEVGDLPSRRGRLRVAIDTIGIVSNPIRILTARFRFLVPLFGLSVP
jgi:hypothetical protein